MLCLQSGAGALILQVAQKGLKYASGVLPEDAYLNASLLSGVSCAFWSFFTALKARTARACAECSQAVNDGQRKG